MSSVIEKIDAIQILDSRGNPTVECRVILNNGALGIASVPSGASVGSLEAFELRDNVAAKFNGKSVESAIENIVSKINPLLKGKSPFDQQQIDELMISFDGSVNKSKIGANAILAVSMANAKAAANASSVPFYRYLGGDSGFVLPMPMMNILNGGVHASNSVDIQEIMIVPFSAISFSQAVEMCCKVYYTLRNVLEKGKKVTAVGDEGGFAPSFVSNTEAMQVVLQAIEQSGYIPGVDVAMALDIAASEFYKKDGYYLSSENRKYSVDEWINQINSWVDNFPIVSIEDAMHEKDFKGWEKLTNKLGPKVQLVGDDVFVTQSKLLKNAIKGNIANAILIKPNQVGTLTETLTTIGYAKKYNYGVVLSHRSGETVDSYIADIAVATSAGQIKSGAPCRGERVEKYNQLLRIEQQLGDKAMFAAGQSLYCV
jgi:enolase